MNDDDAPSPPEQVTIEHHENACIVSLHGEHDVSTVDLVREGLADARITGGVILVDLTAAPFIDSSVVAAIVDVYRADDTPRLRIVAPSDAAPRRLLKFVGLDELLPIYERLTDAMADQDRR